MLTAKLIGDEGRPVVLVGFTRDYVEHLLAGRAEVVRGEGLRLAGDVVIVAADVGSDAELADAVIGVFGRAAGSAQCREWEAARGWRAE